MAGHRFKSKIITSAFLILFCVATRAVTVGDYQRKRSEILVKKASKMWKDSSLLKIRNEYRNWVIRDPLPLESNISTEQQKQMRLKRSIHREKIPRFSITNTSPYSSIVYIAVGCVGTLISPIHVLTAAHCVHDGRKERGGHLMNPLKVGLIRRNGRQHKIRVKQIFVSKEIRPNTESRFAYDYAVLKLVRPHKRSFLPVKATKRRTRALTFHVLENERKRRSLVMYKYSHCPILNKDGKNFYKILAKDCPSSPGDSGTAVFDSSQHSGNSVIGLLSAWAKYRSPSGGHYYATVVLKFTELDVAKINSWVQGSS